MTKFNVQFHFKISSYFEQMTEICRMTNTCCPSFLVECRALLCTLGAHLHTPLCGTHPVEIYLGALHKGSFRGDTIR